MRRRIIAAMFLGAAVLGFLEWVVVGIVGTLDPGYVQIGLFCLMIVCVGIGHTIAFYGVKKPAE